MYENPASPAVVGKQQDRTRWMSFYFDLVFIFSEAYFWQVILVF